MTIQNFKKILVNRMSKRKDVILTEGYKNNKTTTTTMTMMMMMIIIIIIIIYSMHKYVCFPLFWCFCNMFTLKQPFLHYVYIKTAISGTPSVLHNSVCYTQCANFSNKAQLRVV